MASVAYLTWLFGGPMKLPRPPVEYAAIFGSTNYEGNLIPKLGNYAVFRFSSHDWRLIDVGNIETS